MLLVWLLDDRASAGESQSNACALLTKSEVARVQGERVTQAKASERSGRGLITSQCFYVTPTFAKSVNLTLIRRDPASAQRYGAAQFWRERFHPRASEQKRTGAGEPDDERERSERRPLRGVGDEAFWVADRVAAALYVLSGETVVRISLGSADPDAERLRNARVLAGKVLARLK